MILNLKSAKKNGTWYPWFAWRPVIMRDHIANSKTVVWLRRLERIRFNNWNGDPSYRYRFPIEEKNPPF